ncbi:hypothetical protein [Georgenia sp. AZ-5]|uniref:hypothetical protein n=1 Tax=Georgenia sp. AZ-5 TaxID=3367526 RepID=UPI0037545EEB
MIGVIGSEDSVRLALQVAAERGLADHLIGRAYESVSEAPAIARDLDVLCRVLLFTGRLPYAAALGLDPPLRATLDFVPHSAIDLYRTLALVLRSNDGAVPAFVIDTIEQQVVEEVCQDLGLAPPIRSLSLDIDGRRLRDLEEVIDFHVQAQRSGSAQLSLTCLGAVNQRLHELGLPVSRIEHTRPTLHHALTRASLAVRSFEAEGARPAVALLRPAKDSRSSAHSPTHDTAVQAYAQRLRGELQQMADGWWRVNTNYRALESFLLSEGGFSPDWKLGFGVGATLPDAELNARHALKLGRPGHGAVTVLADGSVVGTETHGSMTLHLRETDEQYLAHARSIGVRTLTLARLAVALRDLDPESVTVREIAQAYGVQPRSAGRLMARLERAGVARVRGVDGAPGAGRPQLVYSIDLDRLLPRR